jgi:hypothetical protein
MSACLLARQRAGTLGLCALALEFPTVQPVAFCLVALMSWSVRTVLATSKFNLALGPMEGNFLARRVHQAMGSVGLSLFQVVQAATLDASL